MARPYFEAAASVVIAANVVNLRAVDSNLYEDAQLGQVQAVDTFEWNAASAAADDGVNVVIPDDIVHPAPGRFLVIPNVKGPTTATTDKGVPSWDGTGRLLQNNPEVIIPAAGTMVLNDAGGHLRVGLAPGAGAGAAANEGAIRLQAGAAGSIVNRNAVDTADRSMFFSDGTDLTVGGQLGVASRPQDVFIDGQNTVEIQTASIARIVLSTVAELNVTPVQFRAAVVAPSVIQLTDATPGIIADNLTFEAQGVSDPAGNAVSGNALIRGGRAIVHVGNRDGNVALHEVAGNWQLMEEGLFVGDAAAPPIAAAAAGAFLWSEGAVLHAWNWGIGGAAAAVATAGHVRLTDAFAINAFGTPGDVGIAGKDAADLVTFGGANVTGLNLAVAGSPVLSLITGQAEFDVLGLRFEQGVATPELYQATHSGAGYNGATLNFHAQDVDGTGVIVAGDLSVRAGDAGGGSGTRTGGTATFRGGTGITNGTLIIEDPPGNSRIEVDDQGIGFFAVAPAAQQAITGALSTVADAPAKAVLTSIISALVTPGLSSDGTT